MQYGTGGRSRWRSVRVGITELAQGWTIAFALLVPRQLFGFGWLWLDSDRQLDARLSQAETQRTALLSPPLATGSLAEQKQQLSQAVDDSLANLKTNLRNERTAMLRNSFLFSINRFGTNHRPRGGNS